MQDSPMNDISIPNWYSSTPVVASGFQMRIHTYVTSSRCIMCRRILTDVWMFVLTHTYQKRTTRVFLFFLVPDR